MLSNVLSNISILVHISKLILETLTYNPKDHAPTTQNFRVLDEGLADYCQFFSF